MKKGFTLVELLGVVVVLGLLALILVPTVRNLMNNAEKSTTLISAQSYISGVEKILSQKAFQGDKVPSGKYNIIENGNLCLEYESDNVTCKNVLDVGVKGDGPEEGYLIIDSLDVGYVNFALDSRLITRNSKGKLVMKDDTSSICKLIDDNGSTGITPGDKYQCKVKDNMEEDRGYICNEDDIICSEYEYKDGYYFYVLSSNDDGTTNLIMDQDLGLILWASYLGENCGDVYDIEDSTCYFSTDGPTAAMDYLHNETKDWDNVPNIIMDYEDEGRAETTGYGGIKTIGSKTNITKKDGTITKTYKNLKARMPYYSEMYNSAYPEWITNNSGAGCGYWTLSSNGSGFNTLWGECLFTLGYDSSVRPIITLKL